MANTSGLPGRGYGRWSTDFFGCFEDTCICFASCCCYCNTIAQLTARSRSNPSQCKQWAAILWGVYFLISILEILQADRRTIDGQNYRPSNAYESFCTHGALTLEILFCCFSIGGVRGALGDTMNMNSFASG